MRQSTRGAYSVPFMARRLREVVYVDGLRTAFGRAGEQGLFWRTRADDMAVKVLRELLRRNPSLPPERIGDVIMAATAQVGVALGPGLMGLLRDALGSYQPVLWCLVGLESLAVASVLWGKTLREVPAANDVDNRPGRA